MLLVVAQPGNPTGLSSGSTAQKPHGGCHWQQHNLGVILGLLLAVVQPLVMLGLVQQLYTLGATKAIPSSAHWESQWAHCQQWHSDWVQGRPLAWWGKGVEFPCYWVLHWVYPILHLGSSCSNNFNMAVKSCKMGNCQFPYHFKLTTPGLYRSLCNVQADSPQDLCFPTCPLWTHGNIFQPSLAYCQEEKTNWIPD